jgi:hypothetical protein
MHARCISGASWYSYKLPGGLGPAQQPLYSLTLVGSFGMDIVFS